MIFSKLTIYVIKLLLIFEHVFHIFQPFNILLPHFNISMLKVSNRFYAFIIQCLRTATRIPVLCLHLVHHSA